jgi:hypothetical protein
MHVTTGVVSTAVSILVSILLLLIMFCLDLVEETPPGIIVLPLANIVTARSQTKHQVKQECLFFVQHLLRNLIRFGKVEEMLNGMRTGVHF